MSTEVNKAIVIEEDTKTILIVNPDSKEANKILELIEKSLPEEYKILLVSEYDYPVKNELQDLAKILDLNRIEPAKYILESFLEPQEKYYQKYSKSYNRKHKTRL